MKLCDEGKTILFSTHITSDLDKCADNIIYIKKGRIIADAPMREFERSYMIAQFGSREELESSSVRLTGCKRTKDGFSALVAAEDAAKMDVPLTEADLESIMVHIEKEAD